MLREQRHHMAETAVAVGAFGLIGDVGTGRRRQIIALRYIFIVRFRPFQIAAGSPRSVANIAAALFSRFLGEVLRPPLGTVVAKAIKFYIVTIAQPKLLDDLKVLTGGIRYKMVMKAPI